MYNKKTILFIIIYLILINLCLIVYADEENNNQDFENYSTHKLILKTENIEDVKDDENIKEIKKIVDNIYVVEYSDEQSTKEGFVNLSNDEKIENVVPDAKVYLCDDVSTYSVSENRKSWGVESTGIDHYIDFLNYKNNKTILVAVLDSGILETHEAFSSNRIDTTYSYNYPEKNKSITDTIGHGTAVSSIIAQSTPDNVKIVPIKIFNQQSGELTDVLDALRDIKDKVDVINMSLGMSVVAYESGLEAETVDMVNDVLYSIYNNGNGPVVVCAVGNTDKNESRKVTFPALSQYTIAVSSVDKNNNLPEFSCYGEKVDFSAPGDTMSVASHIGKKNYATGKGTSFSAPFVSALAANIKTENPSYGANVIKNKMIEYSVDIGTPGKDNYFGYGTINLKNTRFEKPNIAFINKTNNNNQSVRVKASAVCDDKIIKYACILSSNNVKTSDWIPINNPSTNVNIETNINKNGQYRLYFMDDEGDTNFEEININSNDNQDPIIIENIYASNITDNSFFVNANFQDKDSGIEKIVLYFKEENEKEFKSFESYYGDRKDVIKYGRTISDLVSGNNYYVYAIAYDKYNNFTKTNTIKITTISDLVEITGMNINKSEIKLQENQTEQLKASFYPTNIFSNKVFWSSSNESVATVTQNGLVKAIGEGNAVISVNCGNLSAKCKVTVYWNNPFYDISNSSWEYGAVKYCYNNGYIKGYNNTTFAPNMQLTRAEIVTILYRMAGSPNINEISNFSDVNNNMWYTKAIIWAQKNGIVHGYSGTNKFGPNDFILRQDLAGILRNYTQFKGKSVNSSGDLTKFKDYKSISDYAITSMKWAIGRGVITGNGDGTLNPKGNTTRAEAAAMICKYLK